MKTPPRWLWLSLTSNAALADCTRLASVGRYWVQLALTGEKMIDLNADIIDTRDIIERVEALEIEADGLEDGCEELQALRAILADLKGMGGDEQWRGDWYPLTLIRDDHFGTYAEELADDIGAVPLDAQWPLNCIDWEQAARELRYDYSGVDIGGVTYWTR